MAVYAKGSRKLMKYIKDRYDSPEIIITENGYGEDLDDDHSVALNDHNRKYYLQRHLLALNEAICIDKVNVTSYFLWSLMDNFEWQDGYTARLFGLYYIDFKNNLTRMEKESAKWYSEFLKPKPNLQQSSKSKLDAELRETQKWLLYKISKLKILQTNKRKTSSSSVSYYVVVYSFW